MTTRYSPTQQALHWLTVVLVFAILPVAWIVDALKEDTPPFYFWLDIHKTIGLSILLLTLVRVALRLRTPPPAYPPEWPAFSKLGAKVAVVGLLALMIAMPITGYIWTTGHGYDVAPFDLVTLPRLFWKDRALGDAAKAFHEAGRWAVYGLIAAHLMGVSYHLIMRRDGALLRMLPPQKL